MAVSPVSSPLRWFQALPVAQQVLLGAGVPLVATAALVSNVRARRAAPSSSAAASDSGAAEIEGVAGLSEARGLSEALFAGELRGQERAEFARSQRFMLAQRIEEIRSLIAGRFAGRGTGPVPRGPSGGLPPVTPPPSSEKTQRPSAPARPGPGFPVAVSGPPSLTSSLPPPPPSAPAPVSVLAVSSPAPAPAPAPAPRPPTAINRAELVGRLDPQTQEASGVVTKTSPTGVKTTATVPAPAPTSGASPTVASSAPSTTTYNAAPAPTTSSPAPAPTAKKAAGVTII